MTFRIHALDPARFAPLFALDDDSLAAQRARRVVATSHPGFPCRVSLTDAAIGDTLLLINHAHLVGDTPYAASHAIYVRADAVRAEPAVGEVPEVLTRRLLAIRAFDAAAMMVDADVVDGSAAGAAIVRLFGNPVATFIHIPFAKRGCFAASASRA